jgi:hypothetical protein
VSGQLHHLATLTHPQKEPVISTGQEGDIGCSGEEKNSCPYWKSNVQPIFSTTEFAIYLLNFL